VTERKLIVDVIPMQGDPPPPPPMTGFLLVSPQELASRFVLTTEPRHHPYDGNSPPRELTEHEMLLDQVNTSMELEDDSEMTSVPVVSPSYSSFLQDSSMYSFTPIPEEGESLLAQRQRDIMDMKVLPCLGLKPRLTSRFFAGGENLSM
jgi:hypothetical protein